MTEHGPFLIIANPTSGRGRGRRIAEAVTAGLRAAGAQAELAFTQKPGDAEQFARDACARDAGSARTIVACGGDGTVQQIAGIIANRHAAAPASSPRMALAPAGRCNDFCRALGIPRAADAILRILLTGRVQPIDLGTVNGRYFCTVATFGLDAAVTDYVDRMKMPLRGTPAYLYGAFRVLLSYRPHRVKITGDFPTIEQRVFIATTANTSLYGGAIPIVPHASPTDGTLDLCVVDSMPLISALPFIPRAYFGLHTRRRGVRFIATRGFRIESDSPLDLWADGERIGTTPVEISVAAAALPLLMPDI